MYQKGDILIFVGDKYKFPGEVEHSKHFKKDTPYKVSGTTIMDHDMDDIDPSACREVIYFEDHDYGCFFDFADRNFVMLNVFRSGKIDDIIRK